MTGDVVVARRSVSGRAARGGHTTASPDTSALISEVWPAFLMRGVANLPHTRCGLPSSYEVWPAFFTPSSYELWPALLTPLMRDVASLPHAPHARCGQRCQRSSRHTSGKIRNPQEIREAGKVLVGWEVTGGVGNGGGVGGRLGCWQRCWGGK